MNDIELVTKEQWKELCRKYNKWCDFCDVSNCTYEQAEWYIKNMRTLEPM